MTNEHVIYGAIIGELQVLESKGIYQGNSHHLAQRLAVAAAAALDKQKDLADIEAKGFARTVDAMKRNGEI